MRTSARFSSSSVFTLTRTPVEQMPLDPWGKAYALTVQGRSYTIVSNGPDGQRGTGDDRQVSGEWTPRPKE